VEEDEGWASDLIREAIQGEATALTTAAPFKENIGSEAALNWSREMKTFSAHFKNRIILPLLTPTFEAELQLNVRLGKSMEGAVEEYVLKVLKNPKSHFGKHLDVLMKANSRDIEKRKTLLVKQAASLLANRTSESDSEVVTEDLEAMIGQVEERIRDKFTQTLRQNLLKTATLPRHVHTAPGADAKAKKKEG